MEISLESTTASSEVSLSSIEKVADKLLDWAMSNGVKILIGLIILGVGWKVIKKLMKIFNSFSSRKEIDSTLHSFLGAFLELALKALLIICVLGYVGFEITGLAALLASAGFALGLALQGSLSNFAGGVIILVMRPFQIGDFIESSSHSGTVEKIELFYTHLITPDNKAIMIPNGALSNSTIVNYSSKDTRRVDLVFGVGYEDDILHVKRVLSNIIDSCDLILKNPEPFINICEHGDSSVNIAVRVWTKTSDYWNVYFYLIEQAKIKFDEENINIPYPQMDLHIQNK
ncbi:MAG: mechanosensitive ion channel [Clostridium sp.]|nr:mechanosensitive ion channel [Clostridium sp.]